MASTRPRGPGPPLNPSTLFLSHPGILPHLPLSPLSSPDRVRPPLFARCISSGEHVALPALLREADDGRPDPLVHLRRPVAVG